MMKYQQVVAESSEEGIYSSPRSSIDKPALHIDMKERMAAWGHKDVEEDKAPPEDIIQEEEKEEEVKGMGNRGGRMSPLLLILSWSVCACAYV